MRLVEGDGEDGPGRVAADAGQAAQLVQPAGEAAAVTAANQLRRLVKLPRTAVIAQPFPQPQDLMLARRGERRHAGQRGQKTVEIRLHRRHLRLLKHDLAQPDAVRIAAAPPGQIAGVPGIPGQQPTPETGEG